MPTLEQGSNPELSRIGYRLQAFADVFAEINIMSEQRGLNLLERALENPIPSGPIIIAEARDGEFDEIALTQNLITALKDESDGIFLNFSQDEDRSITVTVEIDEGEEVQQPREVMKLYYPYRGDDTPRRFEVQSPFIFQEGLGVQHEHELVKEDNYEELVDNISEFLDKKMKRIAAVLGIFPSDEMRWNFEEDRLPTYLTSTSLLVSLMQYGMNRVHDNAYALFNDVLNTPQDPLEEPNLMIPQFRKGWIKPSRDGGYEVSVIAMSGMSSHPDYDAANELGKLPVDESKDKERRKLGFVVWTASTARIEKTHQNGFNPDRERELDSNDPVDSELMASMLAGATGFTGRLEPARQIEFDETTGEMIERGTVPGTLQGLLSFERFATSNIIYVKSREDDEPDMGEGKENELRMSVNVKRFRVRPYPSIETDTTVYRYRGDLTNKDMTNLEPPIAEERAFGNFLQMNRLQMLNLLRALLAAPDIAGGKRDFKGRPIAV